ncbi:MAG: penicillin-binding transpeptidase domain-containing protein, partial [Bdellovibrionota bacterium]
AMHYAGMSADPDLLDIGEIYHAVVVNFDNKRKTARVMVGAVKAELPIEGMRWARPVKDEKNPTAIRPEPSLPSKIFTRGDVIQVRVVKNDKKDIVVSLEQDPVVQGAIFSMEGQTGYVLAMHGGFDFEQSEFNRATQALRQPGSSFKPIIYASALEKGFTPASIIADSPIVFKQADGLGTWKPNNFEEKFYGDTTFRQALIKSRNIPTIKIVQAVSVPFVVEFSKRLGMGAQFTPDLSISLGSSSVSLMEMTRTYALFPRLGRQVKPLFLLKVVDRDGRVLEEQKPQALPPEVKIPPTLAGDQPVATPPPSPVAGVSPAPQMQAVSKDLSGRKFIAFPKYPTPDDPDQVLDPRIAYVMTHLMKEVVNYGTGHDAKALGRPAAGKTGTTSDSIDAWFMGFTPHVVTGVWVGYDSQKSIGPNETGARVALPIWLNFMKEAVKGYPDTDFAIPPGVVFASINSLTGRPAAANSSASIREAFIEGTQPTESDDKSDTTPESQSDFFKEDTE